MILYKSFKKGDYRRRFFILYLVSCIFVLLPLANASARDVTFIWSANTETVDGYRVYYKTGSSGPPYDGTGITEGSSPVTAGNVTTITLHGLSDTETYYFALTAYLGAEESPYSTEIVLPPPSPGSTGRDISFVWTANAETVDGYRLYYKTGSNGPPYDGIGISEGPSPVATGNVTGFTLHGLSETDTYYFALTAYRGTEESGFSAEIMLPPSQVNSPPVALDVALAVSENTPLTGQLPASDPDNDPLTYTIVSNGAKGSAVITNSASGAFTYTPNSDVTGSDSFTFKVNDGVVDSATATVSVAITAVNKPPTASSASISVDENTVYTGQLSGSDPDNDPLSYTIVSNGAKGSAVITNSASGAFTYTPNSDVTGSDSFTFKVNDGVVDSATATVSVAITAVNKPPTASSASISVDENTVYTGQLSGSDPDNDPLSYTIVSNGAKGSAVITNSASGAFTYTPNSDVTGGDSFTFKVNDGAVDSAAATVDITINAGNEAPVVVDMSVSTDVNTAVKGQLSAYDPDGDPLTYAIVTNGTMGSAVITDPVAGVFTYTPNTDATGSDSFTFKVNDGTVDSVAGAVTVVVFDEETITKEFGDTPGADYPGTLADTYTNINTDINAALETLKTWSWSSPAPHKVANTIVMKADLTSIPIYATVMEARLFLYQTGVYGVEQYTNSIHKITGKNPIISQVTGYNAFNGEAWTPVAEGATHNNIPLGLADIAPPEDSIPLFIQEGYRSWVITKMVQEWIAKPSDNYGLLIQGEETPIGTGRIFAATENPDETIRPKLVVRYRLIPPAPQLILIEEIK